MRHCSKKNNVSPSDVLNVLSGYIGGTYASNMNLYTKMYRVMIQAAPEFRLDEEALNNIFVRTSEGDMSPIEQYVRIEKVYGPESLSRFNLFSSISVTVMPADGYSTGQAIEAIANVSARSLPSGYGYEFGGRSREEADTGTGTIVIFIICSLFIYLLLCALYESLFIPMAVMLAVPFGTFRQLPFCQPVRCRKQYLYADGTADADRTIVKDGHPAHRIRFPKTDRGVWYRTGFP